jgi:excisionase family DNA binding protein
VQGLREHPLPALRKARPLAGGGALSDRLLTARELGERLGFKAGTIVDWFEAGEIPGFKLGGRLRFRLEEVEAWMEQHRGKADPYADLIRLPERSNERPDGAAQTATVRTRPDTPGGAES